MQNTWKGLVVGGLTGVGAGLVLDALSGAGERAEKMTKRAMAHAPELKEKARHSAERAAELVREAELPDKARHTAETVAEKVRDADLPDKARDAAEKAKHSLNR